MTPQEIWKQINEEGVTDEATDDYVWTILNELYQTNKEPEAIQYIKDFFKCDDKTAEEAFNIFKREEGPPRSPEELAYINAVAAELLNKPKCPICQSTNLKKISGWSKAASTVVWGVFAAGRVSKTWHCNNCGSEW